MTRDEKTVSIIGLVWTFAACVLLAYLFHKIRKAIYKRDKKRELLKLQSESLLADPRLTKEDKQLIAEDHCYLHPYAKECERFDVSWFTLHKYAIAAVGIGFLLAAIGIFLLGKNPQVAVIMIVVGILMAIFGGNILTELNKGSVYKNLENKLKQFQDYLSPEMIGPEAEGSFPKPVEGVSRIEVMRKKIVISREGIVLEL